MVKLGRDMLYLAQDEVKDVEDEEEGELGGEEGEEPLHCEDVRQWRLVACANRVITGRLL